MSYMVSVRKLRVKKVKSLKLINWVDELLQEGDTHRLSFDSIQQRVGNYRTGLFAKWLKTNAFTEVPSTKKRNEGECNEYRINKDFIEELRRAVNFYPSFEEVLEGVDYEGN